MQRRLLVFLLLFGSFSLVYSSIAYYSLSRPPAQGFMAMGVYSSAGSLSDYFAGHQANVTSGQSLNWHFAVTNQMGSIQYADVVYRLANSTSMSPNSTDPSPVKELGNSSIFVPNTQTGLMNFTWTITATSSKGGLVFANITINGQPFSPIVGAVGGLKFRFFFELWTFDVSSNSFQYGYKGQNSRVGVPLQVSFNIV